MKSFREFACPEGAQAHGGAQRLPYPARLAEDLGFTRRVQHHGRHLAAGEHRLQGLSDIRVGLLDDEAAVVEITGEAGHDELGDALIAEGDGDSLHAGEADGQGLARRELAQVLLDLLTDPSASLPGRQERAPLRQLIPIHAVPPDAIHAFHESIAGDREAVNHPPPERGPRCREGPGRAPSSGGERGGRGAGGSRPPPAPSG